MTSLRLAENPTVFSEWTTAFGRGVNERNTQFSST